MTTTARTLNKAGRPLENIAVAVFLMLISLLVVMMSTIDPLSYNGRFWYDSSVFAYIGKVMAEGGLPYKDAFDHKGPFLYFLNFIGWKLGHHGIWYVEYVSMLLSSVGIYMTSRLFAGKVRSLITVLIVLGGMNIFFEGGNYTEEYALPIQVFALYIFLEYLYKGRTSNLKIVVTGASLGLILMLRANMIALWMVFCCFIFIRSLMAGRSRELMRFTGLFLAGLIICLAPFVIYLLANHIWDDFIRFYWVLNLRYTEAEDTQVSAGFIETFARFMVLRQILAAIVLMVLKIMQEKDKDIRTKDLAYLVYMLVSLAVISIGGRYYLHYAMVLLPMLIYPFAAFQAGEIKPQSAPDSKERIIRYSKMALGLILAVLLIVLPWFDIAKSLRSDIVYHNMGLYNTYSESYNDLIDYIDSNTGPEDHISVFGNAVFIYLSSDRMSASRYEYNTRRDVMPEIMDEYLNDLRDNKAVMIISRGGIEDTRMLGFMEDMGFANTRVFGEFYVYE